MTTASRREHKLLLSNRDVDKAIRFLNQEQFELLAEFLVEFQTDATDSGVSTAWYELLTVLHYLALTCHTLNKSAIWHQQVCEQSFGQMEETAVVLREFLQALRDNNWEALADQSDCAMQQIPYRHTSGANGNGHHSLWERIKSLFQANGVDAADAMQPPVFTAVTAYLSDHDQPQSALNGKHSYPTAKPIEQPIVSASNVQVDTTPIQTDEPTEKVVSSDTVQPDTQRTLLIYGLGVFCAYHQGRLISDWATRKSKSVFKYLLLNRAKPVPKEILMEVFWPDSDETAARNNLNVTIYNLRQVFGKIDSSMSYVLYQDDCYLLNPDLHIWFDYDIFRRHYKNAGKSYKQSHFDEAIREFQAAELVYSGELFEEDRYDDWLIPQREAAHQHYVQVLERLIQDAFEHQHYMECINLCHKLLGVDACLEDTHRLLIRCYMQQGQNHLAIRQYYTCVQTLEDELGVLPSQDTVALYEQIRTTMGKGG